MVSRLDIQAQENFKLRELINWGEMALVVVGLIMTISAYLMYLGNNGPEIGGIHWTTIAGFYGISTLVIFLFAIRHLIIYLFR